MNDSVDTEQRAPSLVVSAGYTVALHVAVATALVLPLTGVATAIGARLPGLLAVYPACGCRKFDLPANPP